MRLVLKPQFHFLTAFLSFCSYYFLFALGGILIVGGIGSLILNAMGIPFYYSFVFAAFAFLAGPLLPLAFWLKIQYSRIEYVISEDELQFPTGPLFLEKSECRLKDILGISVRQNHFQKQFGIGTLIVWNRQGPDKIRIPDIWEPDRTRMRILESVDQLQGEKD